MAPINIQVSRSKVKIKGQPCSWYVGKKRGEGGHECFTNIYFSFEDIFKYLNIISGLEINVCPLVRD